MSKERWDKLLSTGRLRGESEPNKEDKGNEFLSDYYRVVFSSAFRRLQDKTQVNPLASNDFVRRRLTHSVEVSSVGERMGRVIAEKLKDEIGKEKKDRVGKIIATACLLHDIGNPPFGHEGELAIRSWADNKEIELADYRAFDGNAQGFRICTRLQHHGKDFGLNLTAAILSSMLKYPTKADFDFDKDPLPGLRDRGKASVLNSEKIHFNKMLEKVGLEEGQRHPLSYLVEAADDIVNRVVDIEDGLKLGYLSYADICNTLDNAGFPEMKKNMEARRKSISFGTEREKEIWAYQNFRVDATKKLAIDCEDVFEQNIKKLINGNFESDLVSETEHSDLYEALKNLEEDKIFGKPSIVRVEAGGKTAIMGLLEKYYNEVKKESKLADTIPYYSLLDEEEETKEEMNIRRVVDYVSGMTDRFAIEQYQKLSGVSL